MHFGETGMEMVDDGFIDTALDQAEGTSYGCESWTIKKAEHQRIDAFELWLVKTLESSLDCNEVEPVHSKGVSPG